MSTDVRDHGCQVRVTRRRKRSQMGRGKREKSQKLKRKATSGRNRAAAVPFLRDTELPSKPKQVDRPLGAAQQGPATPPPDRR